jgi:two-component system chemotaxis response regulator CheY
MPAYGSIPVLIVDDYRAMSRTLRRILLELGFAIIDEATDGAAALQMLRGASYGLIISDLKMCTMSGLDLLREVRRDKRTEAIPFIMVTGFADAEQVVAAKQARVSGYILKPFTTNTVHRILVSVLGTDNCEQSPSRAH